MTMMMIKSSCELYLQHCTNSLLLSCLRSVQIRPSTKKIMLHLILGIYGVAQTGSQSRKHHQFLTSGSYPRGDRTLLSRKVPRGGQVSNRSG